MTLEAMKEVCSEILTIMDAYNYQMARRGEISTPGGWEHMGDVWSTMKEWQKTLLKDKNA